jgi:hypothetical protein
MVTDEPYGKPLANSERCAFPLKTAIGFVQTKMLTSSRLPQKFWSTHGFISFLGAQFCGGFMFELTAAVISILCEFWCVHYHQVSAQFLAVMNSIQKRLADLPLQQANDRSPTLVTVTVGLRFQHPLRKCT